MKKTPLNYRPFAEWRNNCIDEYQDDNTHGLFLASGYCLIGIMIKPPHRKTPATREGEARALILFNRAVGIWRDPDPELPPVGVWQVTHPRPRTSPATLPNSRPQCFIILPTGFHWEPETKRQRRVSNYEGDN